MSEPNVYPTEEKAHLREGLQVGMTWIWIRRLVFASGLAVALGYLPYRIYVRTGLSKMISLSAELKQLKKENHTLRQEIRHLRQELDQEDDAQAIERVARNELGLIRPGELVFKVLPPQGQAPK